MVSVCVSVSPLKSITILSTIAGSVKAKIPFSRYPTPITLSAAIPVDATVLTLINCLLFTLKGFTVSYPVAQLLVKSLFGLCMESHTK